MLIAQQKRKENIVEYFLYLYQIEDLIRAFQMDIELIEKQLVSKYQADEKSSKEITEWYQNLLLMMKKEGIQEIGHLQFLSNLIFELNDFHLKLVESKVDEKYVQIFQGIAGLLTELKQKGNPSANDVQLTLDTIYGFLLLKMQQKEITVETTDAVKRLSSWLGALSKIFKEYESGDFVV